MIMEDIIRFVEKCGFSISNKEDFKNMKIRDVKTGETLERVIAGSSNFYSDDKSVSVFEKYAMVSLGDGIHLIKDNALNRFHREKSAYELLYCDEGILFSLNIVCNYADEKQFGDLTVEIKSGNDNGKILAVTQRLLSTEFCNDCGNWFVNIEDCNSDIYINAIVDMLNRKEVFIDYPQIEEAFKIILPFVLEDIDQLINSRCDNIEHYVLSLNKVKEMHKDKIDKIDFDIERLKKISQDRQIVKE